MRSYQLDVISRCILSLLLVLLVDSQFMLDVLCFNTKSDL